MGRFELVVFSLLTPPSYLSVCVFPGWDSESGECFAPGSSAILRDDVLDKSQQVFYSFKRNFNDVFTVLNDLKSKWMELPASTIASINANSAVLTDIAEQLQYSTRSIGISMMCSRCLMICRQMDGVTSTHDFKHQCKHRGAERN